jgi:ubiquinone/menaquinone biosynthesis C-methylase UbiE
LDAWNSTEWDGCANKYDSWAVNVTGPHAQWMLDRTLEVALKDGQKNLSVLDIACGDGVLSLAAASRTDCIRSVLASDFSSGMCRRLEEKVNALQKDGQTRAPLRTLVADAQDLSSLPSNSIDICFCAFGLMLIPNAQRAVAEMRRVVKPNGLIAIASWMPWQSQLYGLMEKIVGHVHTKTAEREAAAQASTTAAAPAADAPSSSSSSSSSAEPAAAAAASSAELQPSAASKLSNWPFSRISEYEELFTALQLQPVLLTSHLEQTGRYASASEFWDGVVGVIPAFQPPPTANEEEKQQARQWAGEYLQQLWGAESPFQLTSTALIAIARKPSQ